MWNVFKMASELVALGLMFSFCSILVICLGGSV